jgi:oligopeptidase B
MSQTNLYIPGKTLLLAALITSVASCADPITSPKVVPDAAGSYSLLVEPPVAKRIPNVIKQHGTTRTDHYAWIRAENWLEVADDPSKLPADIREYIEAENAYTKAALADPLAELTEEIFLELRGRQQEERQKLATVDGPYAYFSFYREGGQYEVMARRDAKDVYNEDADFEILLDGDKMGEGKAYFDYFGYHSPDHKLMAYSVETSGSGASQIKIRDLETGKDLPDTIEGSTGAFIWDETSDAIYWAVRDESSNAVAMSRYDLKTKTSTEIYRRKDPTSFLYFYTSLSKDYVFIIENATDSSEVLYFRTDEENPTPKLIAERMDGVKYTVSHWGDQFVIHTNADGALDNKLVSAPLDQPGKENWKDLVPHVPGRYVEGYIGTLKDHLVYNVMDNGVPKTIIRDRATGDEHMIAFDEPAYSLDTDFGPTYDNQIIRFEYSSGSTPTEIYDYNLVTRERVLRDKQVVPSGHNPKDYIVERVMAPARDGELIPVSILRHKDTPIDGTAPLSLNAYGSYGVTVQFGFSEGRLTLVDRGVIYAFAHVRGSQTKGTKWYYDGRMENKQNTFNDFIDAGHYLIDQNYTSYGHIVAQGRSAGGLLMGAISNQEPEMFAGIVAGVPFVDVISTMSDGTLPLTPPEWSEWGNPITSAEAFNTMMAYSPYDQVSDKNYPPMLITGGLSDPAVTYWEPTKWIARLRHRAPNAGPYYLSIAMDGGHGGSSGRFNSLKEDALEYAFMLKAFNDAK